jgi:hypothetical protein
MSPANAKGTTPIDASIEQAERASHFVNRCLRRSGPTVRDLPLASSHGVEIKGVIVSCVDMLNTSKSAKNQCLLLAKNGSGVQQRPGGLRKI